MHGTAWLPWQDNHIRFLYPTTPTQKIAELVGKSKCAVIGRARRIGVQAEVARPQHGGIPRWTPCHIELLAKLYPTYGASTSVALGRNKAAVSRKAHELGIKYVGRRASP